MAADNSLNYSGKGECVLKWVGLGRQEVVGGNRCQGSVTPPPLIELIVRLIVIIIFHPPWCQKNLALPQPATPAPACIGMDSSRVPTAVAVPISALYGKKALQSIGLEPATTAHAPSALPASIAVVVWPLTSPASEAAAVP